MVHPAFAFECLEPPGPRRRASGRWRARWSSAVSTRKAQQVRCESSVQLSPVSVANLYVSLGAAWKTFHDAGSKGVISKARTHLNERNVYLATNRGYSTASKTIKAANVFPDIPKETFCRNDSSIAASPRFRTGQSYTGNLLRRCYVSTSRTDGNRTVGLSEPN